MLHLIQSLLVDNRLHLVAVAMHQPAERRLQVGAPEICRLTPARPEKRLRFVNHLPRHVTARFRPCPRDAAVTPWTVHEYFCGEHAREHAIFNHQEEPGVLWHGDVRDDFVPAIPHTPTVGISVRVDHRERRTDIIRVQLQLT
jgi:hypothetical protein